jgi:hypothetical protein
MPITDPAPPFFSRHGRRDRRTSQEDQHIGTKNEQARDVEKGTRMEAKARHKEWRKAEKEEMRILHTSQHLYLYYYPRHTRSLFSLFSMMNTSRVMMPRERKREEQATLIILFSRHFMSRNSDVPFRPYTLVMPHVRRESGTDVLK